MGNESEGRRMIDEKKLIKELSKNSVFEKITNAEGKNVFEIIEAQPQVGGVEINKDFETILLCAVRYAIGRRTYIPSLVIDYITPLLPYLSEDVLKLIADEIIERYTYEGALGDEKIDKPYWEQFLRKIRLEIGGRHEP